MGLFDFLKKKKHKTTLVNSDMTIVLLNGNILNLQGATKELFMEVQAASSDEEVLELYFKNLPQERKEVIQKEENERIEEAQREVQEEERYQEEVKEYEAVQSGFQILVETGDFEVREAAVYAKGIDISLPKLLIERFMEIVTGINAGNPDALEEYQAFQRFWMWCSLNPNAQSREDLFKFLKNHDLKVNKNGFFFAYRRVVKKNQEDNIQDEELVKIVSNGYLKIKTHKKSPAKHWVVKTEDQGYIISKTNEPKEGSVVGNLKEMYDNLSTLHDNLYTDNHTKTFNIKIGEEVAMDPTKTDWDSSRECSYGLHVGNKNFGFGSFGDTPILVLVNPMKVVAVPKYDSNKMRVWAYLPVATLGDGEEAKFLGQSDIDTLEIAEGYFVDQVKELDKMVKENTPEELAQHKMVAKLPEKVVKVIKNTLDEAKKSISNRVVKA